MIHWPRAVACLFTRLRAGESKVGGTMMSLHTNTGSKDHHHDPLPTSSQLQNGSKECHHDALP